MQINFGHSRDFLNDGSSQRLQRFGVARFQFDGLPQGALPTRWIGEGVALSGAGAAALRLGPEPLIGRQHVVLTLAQQPERRLWVATDGLRPFAVQAVEPSP